jgi:hypothetical protein
MVMRIDLDDEKRRRKKNCGVRENERNSSSGKEMVAQVKI